MPDIQHNISKLIHTALDLLPVALKTKRYLTLNLLAPTTVGARINP